MIIFIKLLFDFLLNYYFSLNLFVQRGSPGELSALSAARHSVPQPTPTYTTWLARRLMETYPLRPTPMAEGMSSRFPLEIFCWYKAIPLYKTCYILTDFDIHSPKI